jgi:polyhydroxyalkanoate synthesis regulator protein
MAHLEEPITIKRCAHQRLYVPAAGRYVTVANLADRVEDEVTLVRDAATGEDITPAIRQQIIIELATHG